MEGRKERWSKGKKDKGTERERKNERSKYIKLKREGEASIGDDEKVNI